MSKKLVSIAAVSEETGIGIETLRVWERRYGKPAPVRLASGHRRYTEEQVEWLTRVADAVAQGHRPSQILKLDDEQLTALLSTSDAPDEEDKGLRDLIALARSFAEEELVAALKADARELGLETFVLRRVLPLLAAIGRHWKAGDLGVRHEHFVSDVLEGVLRELRRQSNVAPGAPLVLMATVSGEHHGLGLLAASLLLTASGVRVRVLGSDVPNDEILAAARETGAVAVALSVSLATCGVYTERRIGELRERLPPPVRLIAGGQGARRLRRGVRGVDYFPNLDEFKTWLASRPFYSSKTG